ncbi:MAG: general secretion pathway protein GspK [Deltaproteobacteria bacterium]|nr:general secretion pathway protein GspK [Deltaproteobacteria bacterium]
MKGSQKGIALLIVLWVMTILTVMVFSFSLLTRSETFGTLAFREELEKKLRAESGIERGIMEIIYQSINRNQTVTVEGKEAWKLDGTPYTAGIGQGGYVVRIFDESGKISLNGLTDSSGIVLKNLLVNQGASPENADIIVDSILDWKDPDDLHRLNGAENDYYQSLPKPYRAKNAGFETLEELSLVRGMTPELLYGTGKRAGIFPFLTVHRKAGQINVNVAPKEVLAALPGMDAALVERILAFRASAEIREAGALREILGALYPRIAPYASSDTGASETFTLEAAGYRDDPQKGHSILATVTFDGPLDYRFLYYKNPTESMQ